MREKTWCGALCNTTILFCDFVIGGSSTMWVVVVLCAIIMIILSNSNTRMMRIGDKRSLVMNSFNNACSWTNEQFFSNVSFTCKRWLLKATSASDWTNFGWGSGLYLGVWVTQTIHGERVWLIRLQGHIATYFQLLSYHENTSPTNTEVWSHVRAFGYDSSVDRHGFHWNGSLDQ